MQREASAILTISYPFLIILVFRGIVAFARAHDELWHSLDLIQLHIDFSPFAIVLSMSGHVSQDILVAKFSADQVDIIVQRV